MSRGCFRFCAEADYESLQIFSEVDEGDAVFDEYAGLLSKFVSDSNVNAQVRSTHFSFSGRVPVTIPE
jgi:hypothetical protein